MSIPEVSVLVPTYNGARYVAETLECILAQTFTDFELLVVDDLSSDDTVAIAEQFAARDSRVRVIRNATRAGSSARNANVAIGHARGAWLKFLYQDDTMEPDTLRRMVEAGARAPLVVAWHRYRFEPDVPAETRARFGHTFTLQRMVPEPSLAPDAFRDRILHHWHGNFIGPTSTMMARREVFAAHGLFDGQMWTMPEEEWQVRVGPHVGLSVVAEHLIAFRVHESSISGSIRKQEVFQFQQGLHQIELIARVLTQPSFEVLRAHAARGDSPRDLTALLRERLEEYRWLAVDSALRTRQRTYLDRWNVLERAYPLIPQTLREIDRARSPISRLRSGVKRRLARLLSR